jgi:ABC-type antimicrobial peptide transport system permease subunit
MWLKKRNGCCCVQQTGAALKEIIMFKNYLKIAFRNIKKHKGYSFINISGLAIGMACTILIFLWVRDELSFDTFNKNAKQVYRIVQDQVNSSGVFKLAATPAPLAETCKEDFPGVINYMRIRPSTRKVLLKINGKLVYEDGFAYADPSIFEIFTFPFVSGDPKTALYDPSSVIITEKIAKKYFSNEEPIGKTVLVNNKNIFTIKGVIKDIPQNSHLRFSILAHFDKLKEMGARSGWYDNGYFAYLLLIKNASYKEFTEKFAQIMEKYAPESSSKFYLQPLPEVHLKSNFEIDLYGHTEFKYQNITIFSSIAIFVLLIACINFMNLSTARASKRAKEVGIRKVIGANNALLVRQFFAETLLLSLIALIIALISVHLFLPIFNNLSGKQLTMNYSDLKLIAGLIGIVLVTGLFSGCYPALYLSSFKPVSILKGTMGTMKFLLKSSRFRKVLVITQFVLSIILMTATAVVYKQLDFMRHKELGIDKEYIIYAPMRGELRKNFGSVKNKLLNDPNIIKVTSCTDLPTYTVSSSSGNNIQWPGKAPDDSVLFHSFGVDYDYIDTFGIKIAAGRNFSKDFPSDAGNYILNETALKATGLKSPIGKSFTLWGMEGKIIGIMKDFNFKSLHKKVESLMLYMSDSPPYYAFIRVNGNNIPAALSKLDRTWKTFSPGFPLEYHFLNEEYENLYKTEKQMGAVLNHFAFLALFISCLGLFALSSFMAEQRTKEISIRKVFGASVQGLILWFSRQYIKWVLIAAVIAWPIAFDVMDVWLRGFAYRTAIPWMFFVLSGVMAMAIALLTVSYQTYKAATKNPIDALKYE